VSTSRDTGYVGQDTLAGSRLRTNLKDISAAISPMTAEFLRDIAAPSVEAAVEYGVGTRMETDDARAAGPVADGYNGGIRSIRVRGLPGATRAVNFFSYPDEVDTYMVDRLEFSRGPNAILYGFGAPAGRINVATKQARTDKTTYSLTNWFDSWNGQRYSFDANLALLPNKLAIRTAALRGREKSWRNGGYKDQDRLFTSMKWQVSRQTTIKAEFEAGNTSRYVPRPFYGIDLKSVWDASGQPIYDNFPSGPAPYNYTPGQPFVQGQPGTPGTPRRDVSGNVTFNGTAYPQAATTGISERSTADWVVVSNRFSTAMNFKNLTMSQAPAGGLFNDFAMGLANPTAALDANWVNSQLRTAVASVFVQQEIFKGLNAELGLNRTSFSNRVHDLNNWNYFGVFADTNRFLPNGQLKPADNLYYTDMGGSFVPSHNNTSQARLALSYEKSFKNYLTLRLAGLGESSKNKSRSEVMQQYWFNGPDLTSGGAFNVTPENSANSVYHRYYYSLAQTYDPNFRLPAPFDLSAPVQYTDPKTGATRTLYAKFIDRAQGNINYVDQDSGAQMFVGQAYLLNNRLVGTFGYRKDRLKNWTGLAFRDPAGEKIAANSGVWTPADPSTAVSKVFNGQTRTQGGVLHLTSWLSAFYNQSNSLSTPGSNFITPSDFLHATIADYVKQPKGNTKDYGLKLTALHGRLFLTATTFHTISKDEFGFSGFSKSNPVNIWNALQNAPGLPADEKAQAQRQFQVINQVQGYMQDSESRGFELELVGRLTDAWSVMVNYSKNKTTRSNIAPEYRAYLDYWEPYWKKYKDYSLTQNPAAAAPAKAVSFTDWNTPATIRANGDVTVNTDSINEAIADAEAAFFDNPHAFEGKRLVGDPLHSVNVRTRYDFRNDWIKGLSVGGGVRIRKGRIAGAHSDYHFEPGSDLTDKYNGRVIDGVTPLEAKNQNVFDLQIGYTRPLAKKKVRWDIQLNVNNVTNQRELIVNNIQAYSLQPMTYRYQDPRQFILTNTFSF
jgi:outer membrane receptor protein involved in Fe transport